MPDPKLDDFVAFLAVARKGSFTAAAAQMGVSQSAISQTIRNLEAQLGVRLLTRTTRSVAPTAAGDRVLERVGPWIEAITGEVAALNELRDKPAGIIRVTCDEFAAMKIVWPAARKLLADYPEIQIEIVTDYGLSDIVTERYDAGVRLGGMIAKDMIAVPIGPDQQMAAVATPSYFSRYSKPNTPQELTGHNCINFRMPTYDSLYAWEFEKGGRELRVRVDGQYVFNSAQMILNAVLDGVGIGYLPKDLAQPHLDNGALLRVLADWCPSFSGYHLYYPSRLQPAPAFSLFVDALRYSKPPRLPKLI